MKRYLHPSNPRAALGAPVACAWAGVLASGLTGAIRRSFVAIP